MGQVLRYLLDSDVLSQGIKIKINMQVDRWLQTIEVADTFLSAVSIQEIQTGITLIPTGRKRRVLEDWLEQDVLRKYAGRIISVDAAVARLSGEMLAVARLEGHTAGLGDVMIGATARVHGMTLATLNVKDFTRLHVPLVSWSSSRKA